MDCMGSETRSPLRLALLKNRIIKHRLINSRVAIDVVALECAIEGELLLE